MQPSPPTLPQPPPPPFRALLADSLRFWELRRIFYNLALSIVALAWLLVTWPHFRPALTLTPLFLFFILALLGERLVLRRLSRGHSHAALSPCRRLETPPLGTFVTALFAILLENYWIADEIYPDFH